MCFLKFKACNKNVQYSKWKSLSPHLLKITWTLCDNPPDFSKSSDALAAAVLVFNLNDDTIPRSLLCNLLSHPGVYLECLSISVLNCSSHLFNACDSISLHCVNVFIQFVIYCSSFFLFCYLKCMLSSQKKPSIPKSLVLIDV